MTKENYAYKKRHHICIDCTEPALPGKIYCAYHDAKNREKYQKIKAKRAADPEYDAAYKERINRNNKNQRAAQRAKGLCWACSQPATHGIYCEKHWRYHLKYNGSKAPCIQMIRSRKYLPIPTAKKKPRVDVGKIITLYNSGWRVHDIAGEMRIAHATAYYWIRKAREEAESGRKNKRTQEVS